MRLTARAAIALPWLLYGGPEPSRRVAPRKWLHQRAAREALRERLSGLVVADLARRGGTMPRALFGAEGSALGQHAVWSAVARSRSDWRLSAAGPRWLADAVAAMAEDAPVPGFVPVTVADMLLGEAMAGFLGLGAGLPAGLREPLRRRNPLATVLHPQRLDGVDDLSLLLSADWLLPYLTDHLARRWIAEDARRGQELDQRQAGQRRWAEVMERLFAGWAARPEHLALFAVFYPRWLRARGGPVGFLHHLRQVTVAGVAAREAWETSCGRLLEPALRLRELAFELRSLGWRRTAADAWLLGVYARELEPVSEDLDDLHRELCRII